MKNQPLSLTTVLVLLVLGKVFSQVPQNEHKITLSDNAKIGFVVTGEKNNINTTQIFNNFPGYKELESEIKILVDNISKKEGRCLQYKDSIAQFDCRIELRNMSLKRDSLRKIKSQIEKEIIKIAENILIFDSVSDRLDYSMTLFKNGHINQAYSSLKVPIIEEEVKVLIENNNRLRLKTIQIDSLLKIKSKELLFKAILKTLQLNDSLRFDSAQIFFNYSINAYEDIDNIIVFADLMTRQGRSDIAIKYYTNALKITNSDYHNAVLSLYLGISYASINLFKEAESCYMNSYRIYQQLIINGENIYRPGLALTMMNLGNLFSELEKHNDAIQCYQKSIQIYSQLVEEGYIESKENLAICQMNIAIAYSINFQTLNLADSLYQLSNEYFYTSFLSDSNGVNSYNLGLILMNYASLKMQKYDYKLSITLYQKAYEIFKLDKVSYGTEIDFRLCAILINIGNYYLTIDDMAKASYYIEEANLLAEKLYNLSSPQFSSLYAKTNLSLGEYYIKKNDFEVARHHLMSSYEIYKDIRKQNPKAYNKDFSTNIKYLSEVYINLNDKRKALDLIKMLNEIYSDAEVSNQIDLLHEYAIALMDIGNFHLKNDSLNLAKKYYCHSNSIFMKCLNSDSLFFARDYAMLLNNWGACEIKLLNFDTSFNLLKNSLLLKKNILFLKEVYLKNDYLLNISNLLFLLNKIKPFEPDEYVLIQKINHFLINDAIVGTKQGVDADLKITNFYYDLYIQAISKDDCSEVIYYGNIILNIRPSWNWIRLQIGTCHLAAKNNNDSFLNYHNYIKNELNSDNAKKQVMEMIDSILLKKPEIQEYGKKVRQLLFGD